MVLVSTLNKDYRFLVPYYSLIIIALVNTDYTFVLEGATILALVCC